MIDNNIIEYEISTTVPIIVFGNKNLIDKSAFSFD
jgi:hypothetical protein